MGALIPLAISLAPEIGKWLLGPNGARTAAAVTQAVQATTGTIDDQAVKQMIARDPQIAERLRVQLAQLAAQMDKEARDADLAALKAHLDETADARMQTVNLARQGSRVAWAPVVVSVVVLGTFGVVMFLALTRSLPDGSETILNMMLGTLAAMATSTVSYWVGSSAGSAQKTELLYRSVPPGNGPGSDPVGGTS
jgi:hypothetical protein